MPDTARTRYGPYVHARINKQWEDRRANIVNLPVRCRICKGRIEAGGLVIRTHERGYVCNRCISFHIRGQAGCLLCTRILMDGPKCRRCGGTGYGEKEA